MRKNYHFILLIYLVSFMASCKQSEEYTKSSPNRISSRKIALTEAQSYFNSIVKRSGSSAKVMSLNAASASSDSNFIGDPNWNVNGVYNLADTLILIKVPLTDYVVNHSFTSTMSPLGYRELVFQKNSAGEVKGLVLEVHPDQSYLQQQQQQYPTATLQDYAVLIKNENFTGFVLTFDLRNVLVSGQHKTNGATDRILDLTTQP